MLETATRFLRSRTTRRFLAIGLVSLLLLVLSYVPLGVSVRVTVHGFGDVSGALGTVWRLLTGVATFASLLLSYLGLRSGEEAGEAERTSPEGGFRAVE
jgi:hypothetical protein